MKRLLKAKENVKAFYEKYDRYVSALIQFAFSLGLFLTIMYYAGYNATVTSPYIAVIMAALTAFLPSAAVNVFAGVLIIFEFSAVSLEVTGIAVILFLMMVLLYFVFRAGNSWLLSFTMLLLLWNLSPMVLPVALIISPVEILVCVFGLIIYAMIIAVRKDISSLASGSSLSLGERMNLLLTDTFTGNRFLLLVTTLCLALLLIAIIRKSRTNYAPLLSGIIGGFVYGVTFLLGAYVLNVSVNYPRFILGMFLAIAEAAFIIFFVIGADYKRTEEVQFEDDDYYYFVKAVPKRSISITKKQVESITKSSVLDQNLNLDDVFVRKDDEVIEEEG